MVDSIRDFNRTVSFDHRPNSSTPMYYSIFVTSLALLQTPPHVESETAPRSPNIVIDSEFDDWKSITPFLVDPVDAPQSPVDFGEMRITCDDRFTYLLIDFGRTVLAQGLDGTAMILLDADGDSKTGIMQHGLEGVDVIVDLSPLNPARPDRPGMGMGVRSSTYVPDPTDPARPAPSVYDIGLMFAPTHSSRRIEFRIDRGARLPSTPPLFQGKSFSMKLVFVDAKGVVADETAIVTHDLLACRTAGVKIDDSVDPLARESKTDLRIMNWNVLRGANFSNPDPFARTIAAINADVILLQELPETSTSEQVREFLARSTLQVNWNVVLGTGGGDLRCAIASRLPMRETLQSIPMPDQPDRTLRVVGALIQQTGRHLLAVAVHLRCCGRAGGPEDQQRVLEVRTLSEAITGLMKEHQIDGIIITGDFNLVGTRDPVEVMAAGLDLDHTMLHIAHPLNLDGLSHVTWADAKQPFAPGRLDFLLYSDSRLEINRSFVYDSQHLSARWLERYSVTAADSRDASDHRPIVADVQWVGASR